MNPLVASPKRGLRGRIHVPGDKSISHRALMIAALAVGRSRISGLLTGAEVETGEDGETWVDGAGVGGLTEAAGVLDLGNSGTAARLLMGILATHPFTSFLTGDASLCRRPMGRVARPLARMGAQVKARSECRLPLSITGAAQPIPITEKLEVPSAQVKSAILFAGLNAPGETTVPNSNHFNRP